MAIVKTDDKHYNAIADAIRSKTNAGTLKPAQMAAAIGGISSGGARLVGATNMTMMFADSAATTLDLGLLDTSSVTSMAMMFYGSAATTLDLSSFDTSSVTDMSEMFAGSAAATLDLSSFDTSSVTDMSEMFAGSAAATGWARTQADADKFNSSSSKPDGLTFIVK